MTDLIETIGAAQVQHGKHNNRIYLMKAHQDEIPHLLPKLDQMARERGYTKIFAKVPVRATTHFLRRGYSAEARVPGFYRGKEEAVFLGKYLCSTRRREKKPDLLKQVIAAAQEKSESEYSPELVRGFRFRIATKADVEAMAGLYQAVFATYPFPIHNPDYLAHTMDHNLVYFGVWRNEELIALASSEIDYHGQNAEMTDFATLPDKRGQGLASFLLSRMEEQMAQFQIRTAYTIARAYSYGMNITFAKQGYDYSGTLTNNTNIFGQLESMNVWHKVLS
jgi:putative beta-lysine N-acetyltransferase